MVSLSLPTGSFADLITQSTCTVDDKTFDGFAYLDLAGSVPRSALNYTVVDANGLEGFDFQFDLAPLRRDFSHSISPCRARRR